MDQQQVWAHPDHQPQQAQATQTDLTITVEPNLRKTAAAPGLLTRLRDYLADVVDDLVDLLE